MVVATVVKGTEGGGGFNFVCFFKHGVLFFVHEDVIMSQLGVNGGNSRRIYT